MRRYTRTAAGLVLSLLAACGGPSSIEVSLFGLLENARVIAVYFYSAENTCEALRSPPPPPAELPQPLLGPYSAGLSASQPDSGASLRRNDLAVGNYTVWADALTAPLDQPNMVVASGCTAGQRIAEGEETQILVRVVAP